MRFSSTYFEITNLKYVRKVASNSRLSGVLAIRRKSDIINSITVHNTIFSPQQKRNGIANWSFLIYFFSISKDLSKLFLTIQKVDT